MVLTRNLVIKNEFSDSSVVKVLCVTRRDHLLVDRLQAVHMWVNSLQCTAVLCKGRELFWLILLWISFSRCLDTEGSSYIRQ